MRRAIQKIESQKNVNDLRQLYRDYGHLFCKQVTIGGRLQSTKIFVADEKTTEQGAKNEFKVSVGLQVSTPIGVGAGVKHENSKGTSIDKKDGERKEMETNVFEAVGGNTILAAK